MKKTIEDRNVNIRGQPFLSIKASKMAGWKAV